MNRKKAIKLIGNIITIVVVIFIIKSFFDLDVDYGIVFQVANIPIVLVICAVYALHMVVLGLSWKTILYIFTKEKMPFASISFIINKSNLMKYIPGNVFQYVGRNELAMRYHLNHADVAFCTVCDVALNCVSVLLLSLILYGQGFSKWAEQYGGVSWFVIAIAIAVIAIALFFLIKRRDKFLNFLAKAKEFLKRDSLFKIALCISFYMFLGLLTGFLYVIVLEKIVGISINASQVLAVIGAYQLSWVIGFVVPGAPGGIGIREAAITLFLGGIIAANDALLGAVIYRFITIFGDLLAYVLSIIIKKYFCKERVPVE